MSYLSVKDAARQLGIAERTVRELATQYEWFGTPLGLDAGEGRRPWVFTQVDIEKMRKTPRKGPGRPRKPIVADPIAAPAVAPMLDTVEPV